MKILRFFFAISFLLLSTSCALSDGISGPKVEPPMPASGTILFQDDFSNLTSGFKHHAGVEGIADYDSGVYRFIVNAAPYHFWSTLERQYTDTRVEVDVAKLDGPDSNLAGIVCRFRNVNGIPNFYFFAISSDGYYAIGRTSNEGSILLGQDQMANSPTINTGVSINHLRADCAGSALTFYVNGFPVAHTTDSTLTSGQVGLMAGSIEEGGVDIIFDQFIVVQP
ncbi:MAG: hypothetical protein C4541_02055 [Candidatus Auribacter fodinae]|uniref:DUF1080 domain-containing protein n=1 Tax=Candidatus Auribacter fodinae TaxID=2093366 RepID=A0A3A4R953_9BACT|nr:MAG: hypothetical protein C4541_02055 [Candidatus Auribacter fodinae]